MPIPWPNPGTELGRTHCGGRPARVRALAEGPAREQELGDVRAILPHGHHQRRLLIRAVDEIDFRAAIEQQVDGVALPDARRAHQRRFTGGVEGIGVGAGIEQQRHHRGTAIGRGDRQRCDAVTIGQRRCGARTEQQTRRRHVIDASGPVQRRCPIRARRVDIHFLTEQRAQRRGVAVHGRIRQPCIRAGRQHHRRETADTHRQRHQDRRLQTRSHEVHRPSAIKAVKGTPY